MVGGQTSLDKERRDVNLGVMNAVVGQFVFVNVLNFRE